MDEYSRRRAGGGLVFSRKASNLVLRDSADNQDRNTQIHTPIRFGSKLNPDKNIQIGSAEKAKSVRQSFRSSTNGKEIIGSSSSTSSTVIHSPKRASTDLRKKLIATLETDSEPSSVLDEGEVSEPSRTPQDEPPSKGEVEHHQDTVSRETEPSEAGSSSLVPYSSRHGKRIAQRFGSDNPDTPPSSSMSLAFRDINRGTGIASGISRYSMRKFKCNLVSDAIQSGCSSPSESSLGRNRDMGRERNGEAESSSFSERGKKNSVPLLGERRNDNENRGISISDSRRMRNMIFGSRDNEGVSVRTRRSTVRTRLFDQEHSRNRLHLNEEPIFTPLLPQPDISLVSNALCRFSEASSSSSSSTSQSGSNRGLICGSSRSLGHYDVGMARSFMSRDGLRQYSLDGVAEVLLALERIEQDEELTYEQLLVLERSLFLGSLPFHDQHRDMRMDIDNMSYEELLALEERMGSVSTALSEESIAKCLKTSSHQARSLEAAATTDKEGNDNDIKCSICQEEYSEGDEVGRLECQHGYHVGCIQQWLRLKNWCPICKISAAPDS